MPNVLKRAQATEFLQYKPLSQHTSTIQFTDRRVLGDGGFNPRLASQSLLGEPASPSLPHTDSPHTAAESCTHALTTACDSTTARLAHPRSPHFCVPLPAASIAVTRLWTGLLHFSPQPSLCRVSMSPSHTAPYAQDTNRSTRSDAQANPRALNLCRVGREPKPR